MYFVGIDIAKRFHEAAVIDEQGKIIVKRIKFQNLHSGYCKLMEAVRKLKQPVEFAMEERGIIGSAFMPTFVKIIKQCE